MASQISFVIYGFLLVIISFVVQSIPIDKTKEIIQPSSTNNKESISQSVQQIVDSEKNQSIPTTTTETEEIDNKKKRYIDDDDLENSESNEDDEPNLNQLLHSIFNDNDYQFHAKTHETPVNKHNNEDQPVDIDDSKVFSEFKMNSNELADVVRKRRDIKFSDQTNRRRKRALSPYDFYKTDSFYDPYLDIITQQPDETEDDNDDGDDDDEYDRPSRSFAPLYWYPSAYKRNVRSNFLPSVYESSELPLLYSTPVNINENPLEILNDDNENEYEPNRYPILLELPNSSYDNLKLQQQYNVDELPINENIEEILNDDTTDEDQEQYGLFGSSERPYYASYQPIEIYN